MGATLIYTEEVVGEHIECDCGYETEYIDYDYYSSENEECDEWECPSCGKTHKLDVDWR